MTIAACFRTLMPDFLQHPRNCKFIFVCTSSMRRRPRNNTIFDWLDAILERSSDIMTAPPQPTVAGVRAAG